MDPQEKLNFDANSKYIKFTKFDVIHQREGA
jgi:hypothetical protein